MKIGPFSRHGVCRGAEATKAVDHDMGADALLVPFGILEFSRGEQNVNQLWLTFGTSKETSDFIADALERWWSDRKEQYESVKRLQIELDNGPELSSSRTQFMKRLVDFSDSTGMEIELVYLPPYHSKYNPIERCWGVLENHWNGALLSSIATTLNWAKTMTWRGVSPIVNLFEKVYKTGVTIGKPEFQPVKERLHRSKEIPKWSLIITPNNR